MRHQEDIQVGLRDRLRRLLTGDCGSARHQIRLTVDWILQQPALLGLLADAKHGEPEADVEKFRAMLQERRFAWPTHTEEGRAWLIWSLMQHIAEDDRTRSGSDRTAINYARGFRGSGLQNQWQEFVQSVLTPLFDFLNDRVAAESSVLYILERFKRRIEWFDREELYARFEANRSTGEEVYNLELQRALFDEGNFITYAKARSASGEADLVGELDTDDALVCDGKVFDADSRHRSYLGKGLNQIVSYAQDYQKTVGYMAVYNISARPLEFPTDGAPGVWPPYIEMSGVRVYLVEIRALPQEKTASKLGKANPVVMSRDHFVNPDFGD